jgi:hypothetical protein
MYLRKCGYADGLARHLRSSDLIYLTKGTDNFGASRLAQDDVNEKVFGILSDSGILFRL